MKMYSVNVGHFSSIKDAKKDEKKLRSDGYSPNIVCVNKEYTLRLFSSANKEKIENAKTRLISLDLDAFISEQGD